MQRAHTSRPGGQTEEEQSAQTSRSRAQDDLVRIRVSGRQLESNSENAKEKESAHEAEQSREKKVCNFFLCSSVCLSMRLYLYCHTPGSACVFFCFFTKYIYF